MAKCDNCKKKIFYSNVHDSWFHNYKGMVYKGCWSEVATPRKKDLK